MDLNSYHDLINDPDFLGYQIHPYANRLPLMGYIDFQALVNSIKEDGQNRPIIIYKDQIVDGRHRYFACKLLKIEPKIEEYNGNEEDLLRFVQNAALNRELSPSQKAMTAAMFLEDERQLAKGRQGKRTDLLPVDQEEMEFGTAIDKLAARHKVNRSYILYADRIQTYVSDLIEPIFKNVINLSQAKQLEKLKENQRAEAIELIEEEYHKKIHRQAIEIIEKNEITDYDIKTKYTFKQIIEKVTKKETLQKQVDEPLLPSYPGLVIFESLNKANDGEFKEKLRQVAEILGIQEKEIWYCAPKREKEINAVQSISKSIHKKIADHDRIINGEII